MTARAVNVSIDSIPAVDLDEVLAVMARCTTWDARQTGSTFEANVETDDLGGLRRAVAAALERVISSHPSSLVLEQPGELRFVVRPGAA